jgi:dethiobiotin synthetase
MKKGYFITGTDTGTGKTFIACALAGLFKETGIEVGVMKPVESGCPEGEGDGHGDILIPTDAMKLKLASGSEDHMDDINPYRFALPVSPNVAARKAGLVAKQIDLKRIKSAYDRLQKANEMMIVEGAGGLMTPITNSKTMADLALLIGLPIIVVSASKLGVLNHTLLTIAHARSIGLKVAGIILNHPKMSDDLDKSIEFNKGELSRIKGVPFLGELPFIDGPMSELVKTARAEIKLKELL